MSELMTLISNKKSVNYQFVILQYSYNFTTRLIMKSQAQSGRIYILANGGHS